MGKWVKEGLIYCPDGKNGWDQHSFMTPTPLQYDNDTIRIYGGFRDNDGVSRIGFIDVDANNPKNIKQISQKPVLDIGEDGCFDDNGVILGDVIKVGNKIYMYYVGFQLVKKAKFLAFTGLAISENNSDNFIRYSRAPVMDRTDQAPHIRALHSIMYDENVFKVWFSIGKGSSWQTIDGINYPSYNIWYTESRDGVTFNQPSQLCIDTVGTEYRIGRPRVYKDEGLYKMLYTRDFIERNYIAGYAESSDGKNWIRKDNFFPIRKSSKGWDSQMICYPAIHETDKNKYMFYNGNNFGETGVGLAKYIEDT